MVPNCPTCPIQYYTLQYLEEGNSKLSYFFPKIVFIVSLYSWYFFVYIAYVNNQEV